MHHKGKVVSRTELIEHIYDQDFDRDSNTIEVFVTRIRKKLGADVITTIRGLGYSPDDRRRRADDGPRRRTADARRRARLRLAAAFWPELGSAHRIAHPAHDRHRGAVDRHPAAAAAASALDRVLSAAITRNFDAQLEYVLTAMIAAAEIGPDGEVRFNRPLGDQRFLEPYSGLYWQVSAPGQEPFPLAIAMGPRAARPAPTIAISKLHVYDSTQFHDETAARARARRRAARIAGRAGASRSRRAATASTRRSRVLRADAGALASRCSASA